MSAYLIACSPPVAAKIIHMGKPLRAQHAHKKTGEPVVVLLLSEKHLILAEALGLPIRILEVR